MTAATARAALAGFWAALGEDPSDIEDIPAVAVPLPARLPVAELAWAAIQAASLAFARIADAGPTRLDGARIAAAYRSDRHLRIDATASAAWAPLSGFWRTSDGWVRTHGNYPWHAAALLRALGLAELSAEDVAERLATMPTAAACIAIEAQGGLCVPVHPERAAVDAALRLDPVVRLVRSGGGGAPIPLPSPTPIAPLRGVRVLDLTRVIAGPVCTRTLALAGADVLRIDRPDRREFPWQHLDTGHGKRSALLDLAGDRAAFDDLLADADVVVLGYRPDSLARLGLSPAALHAVHPHLVVAQLSAWGSPERRGFDSLVQAASGIAWIESASGDAPGVLPAQALDHTAGYLLAAAITTALRRRAVEGGGWIAETSLRRVAAELLALPRHAESGAEAPPADPETQLFDVAGASVRTVVPAVAWAGGPTAFAPPRPWGEDQAVWR